MGKKVEAYNELEVYELAFELQQEIFELTKKFPMDERFSLTDQIRRSSRAIGANISEAWQKRRYVAHFISKLTDADGEQTETRHWVNTAKACCYLSDQAHRSAMSKLERIGQKLGTMMAKADSFCHKRI